MAQHTVQVPVASRGRSANYLRQIGGALVFKAGAIGATFLAIPLMIRYLGADRYGVWSTMLGVISWAVFFDFGIGNGLRNKVAESLARGREDDAASYISSGYILIGALTFAFWCMLWIGAMFVNWQTVFNTRLIPEHDLRSAVRVAGSFMLLNFWVGLISALLGAVQQNAKISGGQFLSNGIIAILVAVLSKTTSASITYLAWAYGVSLLCGNILLTFAFFSVHRSLRPRFHLYRNHIRPILSTGMQFFVIQVAGLVIFTTDKMLITQLFGPQYVTRYDVVFKIFSIVTVLHGLLSAPLWSAYTDAWHRSDLRWMRGMLSKQLYVFLIFAAVALLLTALARPLASLWVGQSIPIERPTVLAMALMTIVSIWNNVFCVPLNGMGKVRLSSIYTIFTGAINLPLAWLLSVRLDMGVSGIVVATALSIMVASIISPLQVYYFVFSSKRTAALDSYLR